MAKRLVCGSYWVPHDLKMYIEGHLELSPSGPAITALRRARRATLKQTASGMTLSRYLGGLIPYHYRKPENIGADFGAGHDALEMILSLFTQAPTTPKFQNSHCGEILSSVYIEKVLGYKRLYCKLTLLTAENTNAHKMDGFFVCTDSIPFHYLFVEAKSSILPTGSSKFKGHRYGIFKQMINSIGKYASVDERFDLTRIRDNLESHFTPEIQKQIRSDLIPPGPENASFLGVSVTNSSTMSSLDDDFILSSPCSRSFDFAGLLVNDLATLAKEAYEYGDEIQKAIEKAGASDV